MAEEVFEDTEIKEWEPTMFTADGNVDYDYYEGLSQMRQEYWDFQKWKEENEYVEGEVEPIVPSPIEVVFEPEPAFTEEKLEKIGEEFKEEEERAKTEGTQYGTAQTVEDPSALEGLYNMDYVYDQYGKENIQEFYGSLIPFDDSPRAKERANDIFTRDEDDASTDLLHHIPPGFTVEEDVAFKDVVKVTTPDGKHSIQIQLQRKGSEGADAAVEVQRSKLINFLEKHKSKELKKAHEERLKQDDIRISKLYKLTESEGGLAPNKEDIDKIEDKYNKEDLFNKRTEIKTDRFGGAAKKLVTQPYEEELNIVRKNLEHSYNINNIPISDITDEMVQEYTRQYLKDGDIRALKDRIATKYAEDGNSFESSKAGIEAYAGRQLFKEGTKLSESQLAYTNAALEYKNFENSTQNEAIIELEEFLANEALTFDIDPGEEAVRLNDGRLYPLVKWEEYLTAAQIKNSLTHTIVESEKKMNSTRDNISDLDEQWDIYRRDYDKIEKIGTRIGVGAMDLAVNIGVFGLKSPMPSIGWVYGALLGDHLDPLMNSYTQWSNNTKDYYSRDVKFDDAFSSVKNFAEYGVTLAADQVTILAAIVLSGGTAAPVTLGASAFGGKYRDMKLEEMLRSEDFKKDVEYINSLPNVSDGRKKEIIDKLKKGFDEESYSEAVMYVKSLGFGLAEGIFSRLTTVPIYNSGTKLLKQAAKGTLWKQATKSAILRRGGTALIYEPAMEGVGEVGTTWTQNLIDGRPMLENTMESFAAGVMLGQGMSGTAFVSGTFTRLFSSDKDFRMITDKNQELSELQIQNATLLKSVHGGPKSYIINGKEVTKKEVIEVIKNTDFAKEDVNISIEGDIDVANMLNKKKGDPLIELDAKEKAQTWRTINNNNHAIEVIMNERNDLIEAQETKIRDKGMGKDAYRFIKNILARQHTLQLAAEEVISDPNMSDASKRKLLNVIKNEFDHIQKYRRKFNNNATFGHGYYALKADGAFAKKGSKKRQRYEDIKEEAVSRIQAEKGDQGLYYEPTEDEIDIAGAEIYDEIELDKSLAKNKRFKGAKLQILQTKDDGINKYKELMSEELKGLEGDALAKKKLKIEDEIDALRKKQVNGFNFKGKEYVIRENAIYNQRTQTGTHEIGHSVFTELLKNNPGAFKGIGDQIVQFLKVKDPEAWVRMQGQNIFNADGSINQEEVIMNFIEEVGRDKINLKSKKLRGFPTLIGMMFNKGMSNSTNGNYDIDFKGETDVIKFVAGLGKKIAEGTLTREDIIAAKKGEVVKKYKPKPEPKAKPGVKAKAKPKAKPKVEEEIAFSLTTDENLELKEKFNKLWDAREEGKRGTEQRIEGELFMNPSIEGVVKAVANKAVSQYYKGVPQNIREDAGVTEKEYRSDAENRMRLIALKWKPWIKGADGKPVTFDRYMANMGMLKLKALATELGIPDPRMKKPKGPSGVKVKLTEAKELVAKDLSPEELADIALEKERIAKQKVKGIKPKVKEEGPRKQTPFSKTKVVSKKLADEVTTKAEEELKKLVDEGDLTAEQMAEQVIKDITNIVQGEMGSISQKKVDGKKKVVIDKTYEDYIKEGFDDISKALPISAIKKKYSKLFKLEKLEREKDKRVHPVTGKITYPGKGIFQVEKPTKKAWVEYFTEGGYTTLLARQKSLAKIIAKDIVKGSIDAGDIKNVPQEVLDDIKKIVDEKATEQRSFDLIKFSEIAGDNIIKLTNEEQLKKAATKLKQLKLELTIQDELNMDLAHYNNIVKELGLDKVDMKTPEGRKEYKEKMKVLIPFAPKEFFLSGTFAGTTISAIDVEGKKVRAHSGNYAFLSQTKVYKYKGKTITVRDGESVEHWIEEVEKKAEQRINELMKKEGLTKAEATKQAGNEGLIFGAQLSNSDSKKIKAALTKVTQINIEKNFGTKEFTKSQDEKAEGFKVIWEVLEDLIQSNPVDNIPFVAALLSSTSSYMGHFMRVGAPTRFYQRGIFDLASGNRVEEHTMPASKTAKYLFNRAIQGNIDEYWPGIKKNYFQGLISKVNDNKLKGDEFNYTSELPFEESFDIFLGLKSAWLRYFNHYVNQSDGGDTNEGLGFNPNDIILEDGKTLAQKSGVDAPKGTKITADIVQEQQILLHDNLQDPDFKFSRSYINTFSDISPDMNKSNKKDIVVGEGSGVMKFSKVHPTKNTITELGVMDKALNIARDPNAPIKKIRVFDFDDTLARTKSKVLYTMPDGTRGKLSASEFAKKGDKMLAEGAVWDFSQFEKVMKGKKGPLFEVAETIANKRGTEDIFILTARPASAAISIHQFLNSLGLDLPLENITGLGDGSPLAKSNWIVDKAAEGYNDFYFADDASANVEAVREALKALDVKSKVQQAKVKFSKSLKADLETNENYNKFRNLIANETLYHGGSGTLGDFNAVWFVVGDVQGAYSYAVEEDGRVSSVKAKDLKDTIIIPDIDDASGFLEIAKEKWPDQIDAIEGRTYNTNKKDGTVSIKSVLKQPNASEILNEFMNWANDNFAMKQSVNWRANEINSLYDGKSITKGLPVIVVAEGKYIGDKVSDIDMRDVWRKEKIEEKKAARKAKISKAVQRVLNVVDIKGPVQQTKIKFSKNVDQDFNKIIEQKTGIGAEKEYSAARAQTLGSSKGKFKFFIPPSAEDFTGLLYKMLGKGKLGDAHMAWFKYHLLNPFARAMESLSNDRVQIMNDFRALKRELAKSGAIPKNLKKKAIDKFTYEDVIRVMAWDQQGIEVEGLSKRDLKEFKDFLDARPEMQVFIDELININKGDGYAYPGKNWLAGTISTDLVDGLNTTKRVKYLQEWQANIDLIFSEKNLNKIEAAFGTKYREALEDSLRRMKSGKNRKSGGSRLENRILDYVNNSIGTVMFLNMRSGVLQTISAINFMNWSFNNPMKAGLAFANQPQYWSDFMKLMNSDFLVDRRNGLRINVSESEIADAARGQANKPRAVINYLLKKGFLVTQIMDSFAIASGGATYFRNRVKNLMKNNPEMTLKEAEAKAFQDFREIAEESQQSSRPDRISMQQASGAGRVILAFANTPMQYNRIIKKATLDLLNGRGDYKTNISKIVYYGMIQNFIFTALQQALFALGFDDEEEEVKKEKYYKVADSMLDNILRGIGIGGQAVLTLKKLSQDVYIRYQKSTDPNAKWYEKQPHYEESAWKLLEFSPPISIKLKKLRQAAKNWQYNKWRHDKDPWSLEDPAYLSMAYVISSITNVPLDRLIKKMTNVRGAMEADQDFWKRVALLSGWQEWEIESSKEKEERKAKEKETKFDMKAESDPSVYSKAQQVNMLKQHGMSDTDIKALKKEDDRVKAILELQESQGKVYKPPKSVKKHTELKNNTNKEEQEKMLKKLNYSDYEIKQLKYEDDRVKAILEGKPKKKKIESSFKSESFKSKPLESVSLGSK